MKKKELKERVSYLEGVIDELNEDILILIGDDESLKALVKSRWMLSKRLNDEIWLGNAKELKTDGLLKHLFNIDD